MSRRRRGFVRWIDINTTSVASTMARGWSMRLIDSEISMSARHETKQRAATDRTRFRPAHAPSVRTRRCHAQRHVRTRPSEKHGASGPHATRPVNVPVLSSSSVVAKVRLHGLIPCASSCACKQTVRHPSRDFGPNVPPRAAGACVEPLTSTTC
jgi:hypothetical protein